MHNYLMTTLRVSIRDILLRYVELLEENSRHHFDDQLNEYELVEKLLDQIFKE